MAYKQLVAPNLGQTSDAGMCLFFARSAFGAPVVENSAWNGWLNTKYKHSDALPNVPVPVWFQHFGAYGSPAVFANWGHVAIYVPGRGVLSSPITYLTGQQWFDSIDSLVNEINRILPGSQTQYVGWSEDISNVRVVEEDDMHPITKNELFYTYYNIYGIQTPDDVLAKDGLLGQDYAYVNEVVKDYANKNGIDYFTYRQKTEKQLADLRTALANEQNKPPKEVIKTVTQIVEKPVEVIKEVPVYTHDQATAETVQKSYKLLLSIKGMVANLFKRF